MRYSAVERTLWIAPATTKRPFRAYLGSGGSFGTVTLRTDAVGVSLAAGGLAIDQVVVDGSVHAWGMRAEAGTPVSLHLGGRRR